MTNVSRKRHDGNSAGGPSAEERWYSEKSTFDFSPLYREHRAVSGLAVTQVPVLYHKAITPADEQGGRRSLGC